MSIFSRDRTFHEKFSPLTMFFMVAFHVGAVAALFVFTWKALIVSVVLLWVAGSLGVGMCYHRLLTHRGYKTCKWMEYFLTICAALALEGGPFFLVATHGVHHKHSDRPGDPHSPADGGVWAHAGWIITGSALRNHSPALLPYVPDLRRESSTHGSASGTGSRSRFWVWPCTRRADCPLSCGAYFCARSSDSIAPGWSIQPLTCGETSFLYHGHLQEQLLGCAADLGRRLA